MDSLQGEYAIKKEPDSDKDQNMNQATRDGSREMSDQTTLSGFEMDMLHLQGECVVKKEPDSDGDENINEPMRDKSRGVQVCGNSGNSFGNSGEESILGLPSDISVPSENNIYEDLPSDSVPPAVLSSQLCSRDLMGSSVKNELGNINVNLSSLSVEPVISAVEGQDPLFHTEFHIKTIDETPFSVGSDLESENDELSENMPESVGVPSVSDMPMKVGCTERNNDSSGAASGCISKSTYISRGLPAVLVKTHRIGRNEPALGHLPGLPAEVNPHDSPTHPSHTTPECERGLSGPSGTNGSKSTDMYCCQICNKTFTHNRHLNFHMRIHAEDRSSGNDKCSNALVTSIELDKHQNIRSERKLFKCPVCDFKSERRIDLNTHKRIHRWLKPYKCPQCEFASENKHTLKVHQRTHTRVKPFQCPECDYASAHPNRLKAHQLTHIGLKPYKCTECNYATVKSSLFKLHQHTHSGLKPYKCTECDYCAVQKSQLQKHQRTHSGVGTYKCSECNYACATRTVLKQHQRSHSRSKP